MKQTNPTRQANFHRTIAALTLTVALIAVYEMIQWDDWKGIVAGVICGTTASVTISQTVKAGAHAAVALLAEIVDQKSGER